MPSSSSLAKGAQTIVQSCLGAKPGESILVVHHKADRMVDSLREAATDAGAKCETSPASELAQLGKVGAPLALDRLLYRGRSVIWLADLGLPNWLPYLVKERANQLGCRHLHIPLADPRLFEQSIRAEPDELAAINARVVRVLSGAKAIRVTSAAGTDLEIRLDPRFPLVELSGRPRPGETHWLPAGQVYTHPAAISGTFVADRSVIISGAPDSGIGRAHPARFELVRGFVRSATCDLEADQAAVDRYLASDPNARKVASIIVPTNYLVRTEIGHRSQDGLLPGLNVNLGFADEATRAPYKTKVQMCLYGRGLTVMADEHVLVQRGRFGQVVQGGGGLFR